MEAGSPKRRRSGRAIPNSTITVDYWRDKFAKYAEACALREVQSVLDTFTSGTRPEENERSQKAFEDGTKVYKASYEHALGRARRYIINTVKDPSYSDDTSSAAILHALGNPGRDPSASEGCHEFDVSSFVDVPDSKHDINHLLSYVTNMVQVPKDYIWPGPSFKSVHHPAYADYLTSRQISSRAKRGRSPPNETPPGGSSNDSEPRREPRRVGAGGSNGGTENGDEVEKALLSLRSDYMSLVNRLMTRLGLDSTDPETNKKRRDGAQRAVQGVPKAQKDLTPLEKNLEFGIRWHTNRKTRREERKNLALQTLNGYGPSLDETFVASIEAATSKSIELWGELLAAAKNPSPPSESPSEPLPDDHSESSTDDSSDHTNEGPIQGSASQAPISTLDASENSISTTNVLRESLLDCDSHATTKTAIVGPSKVADVGLVVRHTAKDGWTVSLPTRVHEGALKNEGAGTSSTKLPFPSISLLVRSARINALRKWVDQSRRLVDLVKEKFEVAQRADDILYEQGPESEYWREAELQGASDVWSDVDKLVPRWAEIQNRIVATQAHRDALLAFAASFQPDAPGGTANKSSVNVTDWRNRLCAVLQSMENRNGNRTLTDSISQIVYGFMRDPSFPQRGFDLNVLLMGPPGSGKTTVARLLANVLGACGILSSPDGVHFIETGRADFVASYIGQTATKVRTFLSANLERVVFIDEAYSMQTGPADEYGAEALAAFVQFMDQHKGELSFVVAGYEDMMRARFLGANPGLARRFGVVHVMQKLSVDNLVNVAKEHIAHRYTTAAMDLLGRFVFRFYESMLMRDGAAAMETLGREATRVANETDMLSAFGVGTTSLQQSAPKGHGPGVMSKALWAFVLRATTTYVPRSTTGKENGEQNEGSEEGATASKNTDEVREIAKRFIDDF